jgi:hypothetical protein
MGLYVTVDVSEQFRTLNNWQIRHLSFGSKVQATRLQWVVRSDAMQETRNTYRLLFERSLGLCEDTYSNGRIDLTLFPLDSLFKSNGGI